jgi:GTP-binding protein
MDTNQFAQFSMEITSARFVKGVIGSEGLPVPPLPTVAFFGRSNVGKSSVINALVRRKELARSNSRAGRTTEINYYLVNDALYFADTPGYGYAKLPPKLHAKIAKYLSWYAETPAANLRFAILVVDAEVGVKDSDRETFALLSEYGHRLIILANKADKGPRNDILKHLHTMAADFPKCPVVRFSAKTGEGRDELLALLSATKKKR